MALFALGLNHRTAPVQVREAIAFPVEAQLEALPVLKREAGAEEAVLLSTCNRSEIYLRGSDEGTLARAARWLDARAPGRFAPLDPHLYRHADDSAVARHAFRVACGLDSMVVGEPQILGQVKQAVRIAARCGTLGGHLDRLFQQTFAVAKEVRAGTEIGATSVSMASAAQRLAQQVFGDLARTSMLFIGAGEMIEQAAVYFAAGLPRRLVVANRTLERGEALAQRYGGQAIALTEVPACIHEFDIVVTCTASVLPIVGKGMIERALKQRRHRPMFIVDLAMPRDVEPEVAELQDVFLHTLDSLSGITQQNSQRREQAVRKADTIIETRVAQFNDWLAARRMVPAIRRLRSHADHAREIELARARKLLAKGGDPIEVIEALSQRLTAKLLHRPMRALQGAAEADSQGSLESLFS